LKQGKIDSTPDFILAEFMTDCLRAFNRATVKRNKWYEPQADKEL